MFLNYKNVEAMLTEELDLRYLYYRIFWKRGFVIYISSFFLIDIFFTFIHSVEVTISQILMSFANTMFIFSLLTFIIFFSEKLIKRNIFRNPDMTYKRLKLLWILEEWFFILGIIFSARFSVYGKYYLVFHGPSEIDWFIIPITLFVVYLSSFFKFNKLKNEYEEKRANK